MIKQLPFLALLLSVLFSFSQEHTHRLYTVYDGLPQSQVQCVAQDCTGYIWAGTKGGVARFDGHEFEVFTKEDGLLSNMVTAILPFDTCIYFASKNGFTKLKDGKFKQIPFNYEETYISYYCFKRSSFEKITLWFRNYLFVYENDTFRKIDVTHFFGTNAMFRGFLYSPIDSAYYVSEEVKGVYKIKNSILTQIDTNTGYFMDIKENKLIYFTVDETKKYISNKVEYNLLSHQNKIDPLPFKVFANYFKTMSKKDYYSYVNELFIYENQKYKKILKDFNLVYDYTLDKEQNLWVADEDGLYCFNKLAFTEYTKYNCNLPGYVWDIKEFPKGEYWFATYGNFLHRYKNNKFTIDTTYNRIFSNNYRSFYFNTPKATDTSVIFNLDKAPVVYSKGKFQSLFPYLTSNISPLVTFYDSIKKEYITGGAEAKLYVKKADESMLTINGDSTTFTRNILAICYDKNNDICLGHKGLSKFNDTTFLKYPNIPDTVPWRVFSLQKDYKGNIWIGTDMGLWYYNYDTIFQINTTYFNGFVTFLKQVDTTWIMAGTTNGLPLLYLPDFYKKGIQRVKYYDRYNGFTGRECGQNGTLHDSENTYWIPTIDRVIRMDPTKIAFNKVPPKMAFKSLSVLGDQLEWIPVGDSIHEFSHEKNGLKFEYVGLCYSAPERVKYKYRLLGYSKNWSKENSDREAIFTNLKPGNYTFEVLACNEDDLWTDMPATYSFKIIPAWWQRRSVQGLSLFFLIGTIVYATIVLMKKRAQKQQDKMESRNRILNMSLSTIKNQMDPHFTFNALNGIENLIMKEDRKTAYDYILKLSALIRNTLNDTDLTNRTLTEELEFVKAYLELEKFRFKDKFEYIFEIDPLLDQNIKIPKLLIQIFVENAIKHGLMHKTKDGLLTITASMLESCNKITIADNGIGREKAKEYAIHSTGKGLNIMRKLLRIFNEQNNTDITFKIIDLKDESELSLGTKVEITIPFLQ
ncbi:MAG: histidine kinase [Salinivirgaceae bacterium]|nr:histidine kinase [Salinivirgaceae bacterium]